MLKQVMILVMRNAQMQTSGGIPLSCVYGTFSAEEGHATNPREMSGDAEMIMRTQGS